MISHRANVSLAFVLGGKTFTMTPVTFQRSVVTTDGTGCTGTVRDGGMADQPWIIGASFCTDTPSLAAARSCLTTFATSRILLLSV